MCTVTFSAKKIYFAGLHGARAKGGTWSERSSSFISIVLVAVAVPKAPRVGAEVAHKHPPTLPNGGYRTVTNEGTHVKI